MLKSNVTSLAQIILDFSEIEKEKYKKIGIVHAPTIGGMYEALTEHIALKMIPSSFDLKIVSGFIQNGLGFRSRQIDRMVVVGAGKQIGLTDLYEYHIKDVLVIFEVKKHLRKSDFNDAHELMSDISKAFSNYFESVWENGGNFDIKYPAKLYAKVTGKVEPMAYSDLHTMTKADALIFYTLVRDFFSPVAIIHGYEGYKTEEGLRKVFIDYIQTKLKRGSFGTSSIPNLTSSRDFSIIKTTGMPFLSPRTIDDYWPIVASDRCNPIKLMIEMIWSKISSKFDVVMPWGFDLEIEILPPLVMAKYGNDKKNREKGWVYKTFEKSEKELKEHVRTELWEPAILTKDLYVLAQCICFKGSLSTSSNDFRDYAQKHFQTIDDVTDLLIQTNHFVFDKLDNISPIGTNLHSVEIDDNFYALSDEENRLTQWCDRKRIKPLFINFIFQ